MRNEVQNLSKGDVGAKITRVDLDTLTRIYVNYRPEEGVSEEQVEKAVKAIANKDSNVDCKLTLEDMQTNLTR